MKHVVIYILIAIFVVSCGNSVEEQERMTRAERQRLLHEDSLALKFAVLPTADCMPLFLAKEKRMYAVLVFAIIMIVLFICRGFCRYALFPTKVTIFFVVSKFIATFAV